MLDSFVRLILFYFWSFFPHFYDWFYKSTTFQAKVRRLIGEVVRLAKADRSKFI